MNNPNINTYDQTAQPDPNAKFAVVVTLANGMKMFPVTGADIYTAISVMHIAKRNYAARTGKSLRCCVKTEK